MLVRSCVFFDVWCGCEYGLATWPWGLIGFIMPCSLVQPLNTPKAIAMNFSPLRKLMALQLTLVKR